MACRLFGTKPLSKQIVSDCQLDAKERLSVVFLLKIQYFSFKEMQCRLQNDGHFALA